MSSKKAVNFHSYVFPRRTRINGDMHSSHTTSYCCILQRYYMILLHLKAYIGMCVDTDPLKYRDRTRTNVFTSLLYHSEH
jgi:hypothetical protein